MLSGIKSMPFYIPGQSGQHLKVDNIGIPSIAYIYIYVKHISRLRYQVSLYCILNYMCASIYPI